MSFIFADLIEGIKQEWVRLLSSESLRELSSEFGLQWRDRVLSPDRTIQLMLLQVLHGNTALSHLPHLAKLNFTAAAFCKARMRIPLPIIEALCNRITESLQQREFDKTWLGHRVFVSDGTSCSMPDEEELNEHFGCSSNQKAGCSFPIARLVFLCHQSTEMITKLSVHPLRSRETAALTALNDQLRPGDVFLADRAYCSFYHLSLLLRRGAHAVLRLHQSVNVDFTPGRSYTPPGTGGKYPGQAKSKQIRILGKRDQVVQYFKPPHQPHGISQEQFSNLEEYITVRELEYQIEQKGFRARRVRLVTTLLDSKKYTLTQLAQLYLLRWRIETNFNYLKTIMNMNVLKSKSLDGIYKELLCYCIVYNIVRAVMLNAAIARNVPQERVSFIDALRWIAASSPPNTLQQIRLVHCRPNRFEPRKKKRRPKAYPLLTRPRELEKSQLLRTLVA
jgi:hypothetical protein